MRYKLAHGCDRHHPLGPWACTVQATDGWGLQMDHGFTDCSGQCITHLLTRSVGGLVTTDVLAEEVNQLLVVCPGVSPILGDLVMDATHRPSVLVRIVDDGDIHHLAVLRYQEQCVAVWIYTSECVTTHRCECTILTVLTSSDQETIFVHILTQVRHDLIAIIEVKHDVL